MYRHQRLPWWSCLFGRPPISFTGDRPTTKTRRTLVIVCELSIGRTASRRVYAEEPRLARRLSTPPRRPSVDSEFRLVQRLNSTGTGECRAKCIQRGLNRNQLRLSVARDGKTGNERTSGASSLGRESSQRTSIERPVLPLQSGRPSRILTSWFNPSGSVVSVRKKERSLQRRCPVSHTVS